MVTTQNARNAVTAYLAKYDIDASKILSRDISAEGYEYLLDPTEARRGTPVDEWVVASQYKGVELRKWPSQTVYENVVRIIAGESIKPDVIEPDNADEQREQRGPDAAVSGVMIIPNTEITAPVAEGEVIVKGPRGKEKATPKEETP